MVSSPFIQILNLGTLWIQYVPLIALVGGTTLSGLLFKWSLVCVLPIKVIISSKPLLNIGCSVWLNTYQFIIFDNWWEVHSLRRTVPTCSYLDVGGYGSGRAIRASTSTTATHDSSPPSRLAECQNVIMCYLIVYTISATVDQMMGGTVFSDCFCSSHWFLFSSLPITQYSRDY